MSGQGGMLPTAANREEAAGVAADGGQPLIFHGGRYFTELPV